jgi:hypothetical protein
MGCQEYEPGNWPEVGDRRAYGRLLALARRRLVGYEHHAEDVVSRSASRWASISQDRRAVARLEQVIKWEAFSQLRSERRARNREQRVLDDPTSAVSAAISGSGAHELDLILLRVSLAQACEQAQIPISERDIEVLELLFAGHSMADVVRLTGLPRHTVRQSRRTWQQVLRVEPEDGQRSASA